MTHKKPQFQEPQRGAALGVRVTPRSSKNEITDILPDGTVKIRLTATPVDGKANEALVRYLADVFAVPTSSIEIVGGQTSRNKLVAVSGLDPATLQELIVSKLPK